LPIRTFVKIPQFKLKYQQILTLFQEAYRMEKILAFRIKPFGYIFYRERNI